MSTLVDNLKAQIIKQLNLEGVSPDEIDENDSLFGGNLGLDSIDALELIVLLQREYGIKINSQEEGKAVFISVRTMADFIEKNKVNG